MCVFVAIVHEACTTMNTEDVHPGGTRCAYWLNGVGEIFDGRKCIHLYLTRILRHSRLSK